ncbi:hypothetical protein [Micromonospora sp. MH33]|uniref:hypothetical protein n=1 Tax=Micromonospora sp. MH33 TaxID=1945509 RepID=UPI001FED57F4|nr:hypothetical protein [Micromonospora sp. MH33]
MLGVVVDARLGVASRLRDEQVGAEEAGLDDHGSDPERRPPCVSDSIQPSRPNFAAAYAEVNSAPTNPATDEIETTSPDRWARMTDRTARVTFSGPNKFVSTWARKSSGVIG